MLKGVDISKYQGTVNFDALKGAVDFVIIKASSGAPDPGQTASQYADNKFTRNRDEARRVGLLRGFYHYAYPEYNSPEAEAQCFHDIVGTPQDGELLVLDYESSWSGNKVEWCKKFLDKLSSLYGGYKPLIYLNLATTKANDWSSVINADYGLWLAQWDYNAAAPMNPNTPWPFLAMRQYSNKENIAGLNPVDGDVFYGDAAAFGRYGYHAAATPAPQPEPQPQPTPSEPDKVEIFKNIFIAFYAAWPNEDQVNEFRNSGKEPYTFFQDKYLYPHQQAKEKEWNEKLNAAQSDADSYSNQLRAAKEQIKQKDEEILKIQNQPKPTVSEILKIATVGELLTSLINKLFKGGSND